MITSYEIVIRDATALSKIGWKFIIIDEGHRLKNEKSRLCASLARVKVPFRLLLTGTPLQVRVRVRGAGCLSFWGRK